jgi:CIC family chloride channel protein
LLLGELTVNEALERMRAGEFRTSLVTDGKGLVGVINLSTLTSEIAKGADQKKLNGLIGGLAFPHVHADQGLEVALERMGSSQLEILPVVSRADVHTLEGIVTLRDVLDSYGISTPDPA